MGRRNQAGLALLLCFFVLVGLYTVWIQPEGTLIAEAFPVGMMAGALVLTPRRARPALALLLFSLAAGIYLVLDREPLVAFGWALASTLGSWLVVEVSTAGGSRRASLIVAEDLRFFFGASLAGSVLAAAICVGFGVATELASWWVIALAVGLPHLASYLIILPHFMRRPRFPGVASRAERVLQWVLAVTYTTIAFSPLDVGVSLVFGIIPFLGWAALRAPMRETIVQLLVVGTLAHSMTVQGFGPLAAGTAGIESDVLASVLALFVCACALTTIPFAIAVGAQRRESWQARREQAKVEQLVQSAAGIAIIGTDASGRMDLFNPGAESLLGYGVEEVLGLSPSIFHSPVEVARLAAKLGVDSDYGVVSRALAKLEGGGLDVEFRRKDGELRTLQLSISRLSDAEGYTIGYVATGEDVTRRVQQRQALEEALSAERTALEHLREIDAVKDAFVSGVSHELRTPITSILGYLEMLEEGGFGPLQQGQVQALGRVKGNSRRLLSLIDDLLMLSRIQDGSLAVATCDLDLRHVMAGAREEMAPALQAARIDCTLVLPDDEVVVTGDEERLGRVLINLLGNAIKFTDPLGKVDVSLTIEGASAVMAIRDTGIGVPPAEQAQLFDRFFRSSVAHERAIQGSGLGLSIARAIVESHGGVIDVESGHGVGSTFRVRLPLKGADPVPVQMLAGQAARVSVEVAAGVGYDDAQSGTLAS